MALPDPALVVLVGASGSGKSVWAAEHYRPDEVVSSDRLRALVGSGEHDLAFADEIFHRGSHQLKGVPDPWRVLALVDGEFDINGPQPLPRDP